MRVVLGPSRFRDFVSFFNRRRKERFVGLLPVPRATTRRAQFGNDLAKLREAISAQRPVIRHGRVFAYHPSLVTLSDSPERAVRAEFRDFARRFFTNVNGDADRADKRAEHDKRDQPGWNVADNQGVVKLKNPLHGGWRVAK